MYTYVIRALAAATLLIVANVVYSQIENPKIASIRAIPDAPLVPCTGTVYASGYLLDTNDPKLRPVEFGRDDKQIVAWLAAEMKAGHILTLYPTTEGIFVAGSCFDKDVRPWKPGTKEK